MERIQARVDESENKMELTATTLQTLIKDYPKKDGEKPYNEEWKDDEKAEEDDKRRKEKTKRMPRKPIHE